MRSLLVGAAVVLAACGAGSLQGSVDGAALSLPCPPDAGARTLTAGAPVSVADQQACPTTQCRANLEVPRALRCQVVGLSTGDACFATYAPDAEFVVVTGTHSSTCTVTVRLADGNRLQSRIDLDTSQGASCPATIVDAGQLEWVGAGR